MRPLALQSIAGQGPESPCCLHSQVRHTPRNPTKPSELQGFLSKNKLFLSQEGEQWDMLRLDAV